MKMDGSSRLQCDSKKDRDTEHIMTRTFCLVWFGLDSFSLSHPTLHFYISL